MEKSRVIQLVSFLGIQCEVANEALKKQGSGGGYGPDSVTITIPASLLGDVVEANKEAVGLIADADKK